MSSDQESLQELLLDPYVRALLAERGFGIELTIRPPSNDGGHETADDTTRAQQFAALLSTLRAQREQQRARQELATLGELSAGIVHEVRNINASIRGFAQIALRRLDNLDKIRSLLQSIERESIRCNESTTGLLALAHRANTSATRLQVNEVVERAVRLVHHRMTSQHIALEVELSERIPSVRGHLNHLLQVLTNLLLNAQQSIGRDGAISVTTASSTAGVEIAVNDTGAGIPEHLRDRIFEPFFTTKSPERGTGLGLAISKRLIDAHGGTLRAEASSMGGARFVITLPSETD